jgi:hypothetical protein
VRPCPQCGQPGRDVKSLEFNTGRVVTCDSCFHEWTDAGAEDVMDTFRYQSGYLMEHLRGTRHRTR